jgi:hypothetical protein
MKKNAAPKWSAARVSMAIFIPTVVVAAVVIATQVIPPAAPAPTATAAAPVAAEPTQPLPLPTPKPTSTPKPSATMTATAAFPLFGRWAPVPETTTVLVNTPPQGIYCFGDPAQWSWPEVIEILATDNPDVITVNGLHEHIDSQELSLDSANLQFEDRMSMPDIHQTLVLHFRLEGDGRLFHVEENYLEDSVYCSASVYFVRLGD